MGTMERVTAAEASHINEPVYMGNPPMDHIFSARNVVKRFGAVLALDDVSFDVVKGEIIALVGKNGAGKSTLLYIIAGALQPDSGTLLLEGRRIVMDSMQDAVRNGIALVSQELSLFPSLSVEENLALVPGGKKWGSVGRFRGEAKKVLDQLGFNVSLRTPVYALPLADQQLLEISRALLQSPRMLILDEPTSALRTAEVDRLHGVLRSLRDQGVGIVYVSHVLENVLSIADELVILRNGKRVPAPEHSGKVDVAGVVKAMLGDSDKTAANNGGPKADDASIFTNVQAQPLRVNGLRGAKGLRINQLEVRPGEVVGMAGLSGAGVEEFFALLFGQERALDGSVTLPSGAGLPTCPAKAVAAGVACTPADRKALGLIQRQSIWENVVSVRTLGQKRAGFMLNEKRLIAESEVCCKPLGVAMTSVSQFVATLSGGNQQKVVFAKWIEAMPSLLILDDPTRGIDVGARVEMHRVIRQIARSGRVVLFSSRDAQEMVSLADRVIVFVEGSMLCEIRGEDLNEYNLIAAMNSVAPKNGDPKAPSPAAS